MPGVDPPRPLRNEAIRLRAMSFNVWREQPGQTPWHRRQEWVLSILRYHQPDIIGAQELLPHMLKALEEKLPEFAWVGVGRDDGSEKGEFTPIFYRRARFDLLDGAAFWLAPDPTQPARGWGAACPRTVVWARLRERYSGQTLVHFNTHFDHFSPRARRESAHVLRRQISELAGNLPVVLTGDLNCREKSPAYFILTGAQANAAQASVASLRDALAVSEHPPLGPRKTWRGLLPVGIGGARLDYIFVNERVRVLQHAVLADHWDGRFASDHLPVVADLELLAPPPDFP